jgi:hypothetical protein
MSEVDILMQAIEAYAQVRVAYTSGRPTPDDLDALERERLLLRAKIAALLERTTCA